MGDGRRTRGQRILSQAEVEAEIIRLIDQMEDELSDLVTLAEADANDEHDYRVARAKATLEASNKPGSGRDGATTVDEREAMALEATKDLRLKSKISTAHYEVAKSKLRFLATELDALRTIAANIRGQT